MAGNIDKRLTTLGITLPDAATPVANYIPTRIVGDLLFVSGQISRDAAGGVIAGKLGAGLTTADGAEAARRCGLALFAQAKAALAGDLDRIVACVKLLGFVNGTAEFTAQPAVVNGCSDLLVEVLGEAGRHARSAVGVNALPMNAAVEVEAIFQIARS